MQLRNVSELITQIRRQAKILDSSATNGVSSSEIVQYLNDAQDRLQSLISAEHSTAFEVDYSFSPVANQEAYDIPEDCFAVNRIRKLQYSPTGNAREYYPLKRGILEDRYNGSSSSPSHYIVRGNKLLIQPTISLASGTFRLVYQRVLPNLDIRRGKVLLANSSGLYYTTIELDTSYANDEEALSVAEYVTVVNSRGTIIYPALAVSSYNTSTQIITLDSSTALVSGGTISAGHFVVSGYNATTHPSVLLGDLSERYLICYGTWKCQRGDSNSDAGKQETELEALESDIVASFSMINVDQVPIPHTEDDI